MLRVNTRVTFFSKMGYIFIKFGSEWLKSSPVLPYSSLCEWLV
uniref:Uncharacterized protein n=1 Tax=Siphoviridae sp. ctigT3 TaxID=2826434 RepID=A0A8S5MTK6_9CAUD|nr:MAG TPA: hypothetical protein [Siphoviridae sp. ctigT3]